MGAPTAQLSLVQLGLQHASAHVQALEVSLRQGTQRAAGKPGMLFASTTWARVAGRVVQLSMMQLGVRTSRRKIRSSLDHSQARGLASYNQH